ncbi:MAG: alkane 1-monooxygenase [Boseongicola sp.]|nr:MAG: alkane 1-monooxygenase [Boseongicola sp.]
MTSKSYPNRVPDALPFWASLTIVPVTWVAATVGGIGLGLIPMYAWVAFSVMDYVFGTDPRNPDIETPNDALFWHRAVTWAWPPVQIVNTFALLAFATTTDHLGSVEKIALFLGVGIVNGTIGIVYAHELMHKSSRWERFLGDALMAMALYGHYRSEHLLVHHSYVGTPRDPATARYNEHFWRFFPRVLWQSLVSSWNAEKAMLVRRKRPMWHRSNSFWRYIGLDVAFIALAAMIGGWSGVLLFAIAAGFAVFQLELVNYIEHYGLTRKHLGDGKYEPAKAHHSWNSGHAATSALLINVTRHSDHHARPDRPFPLLQNPLEDEAPFLPQGYAIMTTMALIPPLWLRRMNPRVREWRRTFYPEIKDWRAYNSASNPMPK